MAMACAFGPARAAVAPPLDCSRVDAATAASFPADRAPRIVLLQGSLGIVTMAPFGAFLQGMGYPAAALVDPRTGEMTTDSDLDGSTLAGWLRRGSGSRSGSAPGFSPSVPSAALR